MAGSVGAEGLRGARPEPPTGSRARRRAPRGKRTRSTAASTPPVAAATSASPSAAACDGNERPGQAVVAALRDEQAADLVEPALVATTPIVVFVARPAPDVDRGQAARGQLARRRPSSMSPTAFTATSAATTSSPSPHGRACRGRRGAACSRSPPLRRPSLRSRPRPRRPAHGRSPRPRRRRSPRPRPGRTDPSPTARSNSARRDDDRHRPGRGREADAPLLAAPHHAVGRGEPERRAAGQHHRVEAVDRCGRVEAARTRGSPARRRAPRPTRPCPRGTARPCSRSGPGVGPVPDPHARDVGDHASPRRYRRGDAIDAMPHTIS